MTETTDDLRARIVAAIRRAPFKELRTVDYPNGQLQITANVDDLAAAVLRTEPAAVPSAPAARAAILREAVERLRQVPFTNVLTELRRMADEATAEHHTVDGVRHLCHAGDHYCPQPSADEAQQPECTASRSGHCLREAESEIACDTEAGECVHGGKPGGEAQQPEAQAENPARVDGLRPEFTDHASVESIDAQLQRARSQLRRWHLRVEWLISLRQARVEQKECGEWPAAVSQPKEA